MNLNVQEEGSVLKAVILTALPVEYLSVKSHLTNLIENVHPKGTIYEEGDFSSNGQVWKIGIVEIGAGNEGAAMEAERAIQHFNPNLTLFIGVAGGVKDVALGDVVVASKVYGYESVKAEETLQIRPNLEMSTYRMLQRAKAEAKKIDWMNRLKSDIPNQPNVLLGPIAAGGKVVSSTRSATFQFLKSNYNDLIAVEMEGYGFLKAIHANQQDALVIRGISDLICNKTEADNSGWQKIASENASAFAFEIIAKSDSLFDDNQEKIINPSNDDFAKDKLRPVSAQMKYTIFKEVYEYAKSYEGMQKTNSEAEKFARNWSVQFIECEFDVFKEVYEYAKSYEGMQKTNREAEKFAVENMSEKNI